MYLRGCPSRLLRIPYFFLEIDQLFTFVRYKISQFRTDTIKNIKYKPKYKKPKMNMILVLALLQNVFAGGFPTYTLDDKL